MKKAKGGDRVERRSVLSTRGSGCTHGWVRATSGGRGSRGLWGSLLPLGVDSRCFPSGVSPQGAWSLQLHLFADRPPTQLPQLSTFSARKVMCWLSRDWPLPSLPSWSAAARSTAPSPGQSTHSGLCRRMDFSGILVCCAEALWVFSPRVRVSN